MTPENVIEYFGTQVEAAKALNVTRQIVSYWLREQRIPIKTQALIQLQTGGKLRADKTELTA